MFKICLTPRSKSVVLQMLTWCKSCLERVISILQQVRRRRNWKQIRKQTIQMILWRSIIFVIIITAIIISRLVVKSWGFFPNGYRLMSLVCLEYVALFCCYKVNIQEGQKWFYILSPTWKKSHIYLLTILGFQIWETARSPQYFTFYLPINYEISIQKWFYKIISNEIRFIHSFLLIICGYTLDNGCHDLACTGKKTNGEKVFIKKLTRKMSERKFSTNFLRWMKNWILMQLHSDIKSSKVYVNEE
jgi:hypothetical protein